MYCISKILSLSTITYADEWEHAIETGLYVLTVDGDADCYMYDASKSGVGLSISYLFY